MAIEKKDAVDGEFVEVKNKKEIKEKAVVKPTDKETVVVEATATNGEEVKEEKVPTEDDVKLNGIFTSLARVYTLARKPLMDVPEYVPEEPKAEEPKAEEPKVETEATAVA